MERDGTEIVPKDVQRYVNEKLVYFMEEICTFTVVEGLHRLIVSFFQLWLVCASTLLVYVTLYFVCVFVSLFFNNGNYYKGCARNVC